MSSHLVNKFVGLTYRCRNIGYFVSKEGMGACKQDGRFMHLLLQLNVLQLLFMAEML